ncbi:MAG: hypothetical protein ABH952_06035 [Candidatus Omnitrophota bacterium]
MARVRGIHIIAILEYLKKKGVNNQVLSALGEQKYKIDHGLNPYEWYSIEEIETPLLEAADKIIGKGNEQFFIDMGWYDAEYNAKWYLKLFFKFISPSGMIKKLPTLWSIYFDTGGINIISLDKNSAMCRLIDIHTISLLDLKIKGWILYALEKAGAKNVRCDITKGSENNKEYTELGMEWE